MADETLIVFGSELKALGDNRFGGYLVVFGDPTKTDLQGEYFDANTDFGIDWDESTKVPVYFNHGADPVFKKRKLGRANLRIDNAGIWSEVILSERDEYEKALVSLARKGVFGLSSGSAGHLIEREPRGSATYIKSWPIVEASITHTPAEWRTQVIPLKSIEGELKSLLDSTPDVTPEAASEGGSTEDAAHAKAAEIQVIEDRSMAENEVKNEAPPAENDAVKALEAKLNALSEGLSTVTKYIENLPTSKNPGFVSVDGGKADKEIKTLPDFIMAIARHDEARLKSVYGTTKDVDTLTGGSGGYLVPEEFRADLFRIAYNESPIVARVNRIPVRAPAGSWPALDQYFAPTAGSGNTAAAGRMTSAKRSEKGAYTETQPEFELLKWRVNDAVSGYVEASRELRQDSAVAIEALLRQLIGVTVNSKLEYYILRGSGQGEPLGILNWAGRINVTPATDNSFTYEDALAMIARFKSVSGGGVWLHHQSVLPDIGQFENGTGGSVLVANQQQSFTSLPILGYQRVMSEHLPQANNSGDVVLTDLGAYNLFVREELYIDFSEHVGFLNGMDTWRFGMRVDGMPALKNSITLADPQGSYTVGPVVVHND